MEKHAGAWLLRRVLPSFRASALLRCVAGCLLSWQAAALKALTERSCKKIWMHIEQKERKLAAAKQIIGFFNAFTKRTEKQQRNCLRSWCWLVSQEYLNELQELRQKQGETDDLRAQLEASQLDAAQSKQQWEYCQKGLHLAEQEMEVAIKDATLRLHEAQAAAKEEKEVLDAEGNKRLGALQQVVTELATQKEKLELRLKASEEEATQLKRHVQLAEEEGYKLKLAEQQAALDVQAAEAAARERERFEKERVPLPMDAKGRAILPPPWKCTRCGFNNKAKTAVQITNCEMCGASKNNFS